MDVFAQLPCTGRNLSRYVQPVLLALLLQRPRYGYALPQDLAATGLFGDNPPDAAGIYRMLKSMEANGILASASEGSSAGPARRLYAPTELGWACMDRWVQTLASHRAHLDRVLSGLMAMKPAVRKAAELVPFVARAESMAETGETAREAIGEGSEAGKC
ncbi:MAG: PadR family transcriptional regulator [Desulfovibrio sp.]|nr:PadR family transcriptional regulator [Desulfovibrio sp.]MBQ2477540.1 PadR family transcriptional regulator [Desulfovibrio sp.]